MLLGVSDGVAERVIGKPLASSLFQSVLVVELVQRAVEICCAGRARLLKYGLDKQGGDVVPFSVRP